MYSCGSSEIFTKRSRSPGSSDMEKSLQSCCGPFWKLETCSNCVKLCKIQKLLQQKDSVFFFLIYFRFFVFFFDCSLRFCVRFLSVLVYQSQIWQNPRIAKKNYFFSFLFPFFLVVFQCFSNYFRTEKTLTFSIYLQIICSNPKKQFSIYIFELFSKLRKKMWTISDPEAHVDFVYAITGAIATVIFATLARFVACFGNIPWWWKTNLVRFRLNRWWSCDVLGDDENDNKWISNVWLAEIVITILFIGAVSYVFRGQVQYSPNFGQIWPLAFGRYDDRKSVVVKKHWQRHL